MAKRRCFSDQLPRVSKGDYDRFNIEALLDLLCDVPDSALIDATFEFRSTDSDQNDFIQRVLHLRSVLLEAHKRFLHKHSSVRDAFIWPFHFYFDLFSIRLASPRIRIQVA
ncbi:unnamed protein product [Lactuca virosa]|uniref:Uncharacterized protein n=1 Tax=Lactuca virosa TaxID=75947 RepID=A0AAU9P6Z1_9ASTR|nr:unnamed protein product [Lactuca virosa]